MGFVSDQTALTTRDVESRLELVTISGGWNGHLSFQLVSMNDENRVLAGFSAVLKSRPSTTEESEEMQGVEEIGTWFVETPQEPGFILPGHTLDETESIIQDALCCFKIVHGNGPKQTMFRVEISNKIRELF